MSDVVKETTDIENQSHSKIDTVMEKFNILVGELLNDKEKQTAPELVTVEVETKLKEAGFDDFMFDLFDIKYQTLIKQSESFYKGLK